MNIGINAKIDGELSLFLKETFPQIRLEEPIHLQLSSIEMVHMVSAIEKHFHIEIDHQDIKQGFLKEFSTMLTIFRLKRNKAISP